MLCDAVGEGADFYGAQLAPVAGCTWEMWIKPVGWSIINGGVSAGGNRYLIDNTDLSAGVNQMFYAFVPGGSFWVIRTGAVTLNPFLWAPPLMDGADGTWHHLALVWAAAGIGITGDTRQIYWDGAEVADTGIALVPWPTFSLANPWTIGNRNGGVGAYNNPFDGEIDNIKVFNYAKTNFDDRFTEGFAPPAPPVFAVANPIDIRTPRIVIAGRDIACDISGTPKLMEKRSLETDLSFPDECEITAKNFSRSYSLQHPRSFFAGGAWRNSRVEIWDRENLKIWDGILSQPKVNHGGRVTGIVSRSRSFEFRKYPVVYTSAAFETPATALLNVATALGFEDYLDTNYITQSVLGQDADGIFIFVTLTSADNISFQTFINAMGTYGCADVYEHVGRIRYDYYRQITVTPTAQLAECDLVATLKTTEATTQFYNDYAIWEVSGGGSTVTDALGSNIGQASRTANGQFLLQKVPGTLDAKYQVRDSVAATAIGDAYIRRTHVALATNPRPRVKIQSDIRTLYRSWVDLATEFGLTYAREGWTNKPFKVVSFTRDDDKRRISIVGMEWES